MSPTRSVYEVPFCEHTGDVGVDDGDAVGAAVGDIVDENFTMTPEIDPLL